MNMDQVISEESSMNLNSRCSAYLASGKKSSQRQNFSNSPLSLGDDSYSSEDSNGRDLCVDKLPVKLRKRLINSV